MVIVAIGARLGGEGELANEFHEGHAGKKGGIGGIQCRRRPVLGGEAGGVRVVDVGEGSPGATAAMDGSAG